MDQNLPAGRRGTVRLSELIGKILDPVSARRGFGAADLIASWSEIVGERYAGCSRPEKIVWPKGPGAADRPALLVLRVEGPRAVLLQHEAGQIVERVNAFLGYGAIGQIRIQQGPLPAAPALRQPAPMPPAALEKLDRATAGVADPRLKEALDRLGRGVLSEAAGRAAKP